MSPVARGRPAARRRGRARRGALRPPAGRRRRPRTACSAPAPRSRLRLATSSSEPEQSPFAAATARSTSRSGASTVGLLGKPQLARQVGALEAPADAPRRRPWAASGSDCAAAQPLARRQAAGGAVARGQRRRQRLERPEPGDLLDQVGLARDVGAAERRARSRRARRAREPTLNSSACRISAHRAPRQLDSQQARDPRVAQADRLRPRPGPADVDRARARARAPQSSIISWVATACASSACSG